MVSGPEEFASAIRASGADLIAAGNVQELVVVNAHELLIEVSLNES
jgi:hypothetical protein